jgi:hypothetical protein
LQRASRGADSYAETDPGIRQILKGLQPSCELPPKRTPDDGRRDVKLADENLAMQPLRGERTKQRTSQEVFVRCRFAA